MMFKKNSGRQVKLCVLKKSWQHMTFYEKLTLRKTCRNLAYWFKFVFNGYLPLRPTAWLVKA